MKPRHLAVVLLLLHFGCASEREEVHVRARSVDSPRELAHPSTASLGQVPTADTPSTPETPPGDLVDATASISAAAVAREAAGRASSAQRAAEAAAQDAQQALARALDAIRLREAPSSSAAGAADAQAAAEASAAAATDAGAAAADAGAAASEARRAAPSTAEGERARRQATDAESAAAAAANAARSAAERAGADAKMAASAVAVAEALAEAKDFVDKTLSSRRSITETMEAAAAAATAAATEADRAAVASDEGREGELAAAVATARGHAEGAADAAAAIEGHLAISRAQLASVADGVNAAIASGGGVASHEAHRRVDELIEQLAAHEEWLAALATDASARAAEADRSADRAEALDLARTGSPDASALDLPDVPTAPPEDEQRPTGIVKPSPAPSASVPDHGRWRQVEGGSDADWLPGGYSESILRMRADGVLEVRRTFADDLVLTWRLSYRLSSDRTSIALGADERLRPPAGSLLGFEGGPVAAAERLPLEVSCQPLGEGRLRIGRKIYELLQ